MAFHRLCCNCGPGALPAAAMRAISVCSAAGLPACCDLNSVSHPASVDLTPYHHQPLIRPSVHMASGCPPSCYELGAGNPPDALHL